MRKVVLTAALTVAATGVLVMSAAASPPIGDPLNPSFPPAAKMCATQGGTFGFAGPGAFYYCQMAAPFTQGQLSAARGMCEGAYAGIFVPGAFGDGPNYICLPFAGRGA